jgi:hypothetical protein
MDKMDKAVSFSRATDWMEFEGEVFNHLGNYTIPQYGDRPHDQVTKWTPEDCIKAIEKYTARFGKNARGAEEQLKDLLKIAHYAQICWTKLQGREDV